MSAFTEEHASKAAEAWFADLGPGELVSSDWCDAEAASALFRKVRKGELTSAAGHIILQAIRTRLIASAELISVGRVHFRSAADLLVRSPSSLRAGDVLHLALADYAAVTLWTLDTRMAEAGQALGLGTRLLR